MRRLSAGLLIVATAALVAALPAAGKEGVKATLTTTIPLDAKPGTKFEVGWTLASHDEHGRRHPFGANGVLVRLLSASGAGAETGFAPVGAYPTGEYRATVVVPKGGIGDVQIGLLSWTNGPSGTRVSDALFPITNDPMPGAARIVPERMAGGSRAWIFVVVASALFAICISVVAIVRRKQPLVSALALPRFRIRRS